MTSVTHYDTLKVARDAPQDVIRAVYKALAQKYHPDRNLDNPEAVQLMQLINVSYTLLSDPQKRSEYDRSLGKPVPPPTLQQQPAAAAKPVNKPADEAAAWSAFAAKEAKEAAEAKARAVQAAAKAQAAPAHEKAKWAAFVETAAADAKAAEEKAKKSAAQAQAARDKAGIKDTGPVATNGTKVSHYANLKIAEGAPLEVVKAAYKILAQGYQAAEATGDAAAAAAMQSVTQSYKILSDPQKRAEYDASLRPKESLQPQARKIAVRTPTAREQAAQANAEKAAAQAAAFNALAERAAEEEREAKAKAAKAAKDAQDKAKDKEAAKWTAYAAKLAAEAKAATDRAAKAAADAANAKYKAAMALKEKEMAARIADDDWAKAEKERALWAQTEKQG
jgi:DnaJ-class molecular chaperone